MSYNSHANNGVVLFWKKKNYQIWFCLLYLYMSIIKAYTISKFVLATNVMYVYNVYLDCIRDLQQCETKKVKMKSSKDKSTLIIIILNGYLYMCFVWKIERLIDTEYSMLQECDKKNKEIFQQIFICYSNILANFGLVFVSFIMGVSSVTGFCDHIFA